MDITINKERFSNNDVEVAIAGNIMNGVLEITHEKTQDIKPEYVIGNKKVAGYTKGKEAFKGSITILLEDYIAWEAGLGKSILAGQPFPITIAYLKPGFFWKKTLSGCIPLGDAQTIQSSSNDALAVKIDLFVIDII